MEITKLVILLTVNIFMSKLVKSGPVPAVSTCVSSFSKTLQGAQFQANFTQLIRVLSSGSNNAFIQFRSYVGYDAKPFSLKLFEDIHTSHPDWSQKTEQEKFRIILVDLSVFKALVHAVWRDLELTNSDKSPIVRVVSDLSYYLNGTAAFIKHTIIQTCGSSSLPTIKQVPLDVLTQRTKDYLSYVGDSSNVGDVRNLAILLELQQTVRDLQSHMISSLDLVK